MANADNLQDFKNYIDSFISGSIPINTAFDKKIAKALVKYAKDKGLGKPQDSIRLAVSQMLTREGYI
jgi:hypothetical protein